jgi:hypothetical protein
MGFTMDLTCVSATCWSCNSSIAATSQVTFSDLRKPSAPSLHCYCQTLVGSMLLLFTGALAPGNVFLVTIPEIHVFRHHVSNAVAYE